MDPIKVTTVFCGSSKDENEAEGSKYKTTAGGAHNPTTTAAAKNTRST